MFDEVIGKAEQGDRWAFHDAAINLHWLYPQVMLAHWTLVQVEKARNTSELILVDRFVEEFEKVQFKWISFTLFGRKVKDLEELCEKHLVTVWPSFTQNTTT